MAMAHVVWDEFICSLYPSRSQPLWTTLTQGVGLAPATGAFVLAQGVGCPWRVSRDARTNSLSPAPQPAPVSWWHFGQCTQCRGGALITLSAAHSPGEERGAAAPAMSGAARWLRGGTQTAAAPPDSPRVGRFPPPHPGSPAFESAMPQKHPCKNNPAGVLL